MRALATGVRVGPFTLQDPLGSGATAEVWRAMHDDSGTEVAVKLWAEESSPATRETFGREARILASLDHPGVLVVHATGTWEDRPWVASELAQHSRLRRVGRWLEVSELLGCFLEALAHVHARGVVHRDLKPANILGLPGADGRIRWKLADFGISRIVESAAAPGGSVTGTPAFMAPEQIRGARHLEGPWTDLYALGALGWWLVTGAPPHHHPDPQQTLRAQLTEPLPPLAHDLAVPEGLRAWLARLLARRPEDRYRFAADAAHGLLDLGAATLPPTDGPAHPGTAGSATFRLDLDPPETGSAAPESLLPIRPAPIPDSWRPLAWLPPRRHLLATGLELHGARSPRIYRRTAEKERLWDGLRRAAAGAAPVVSLVGPERSGRRGLAHWLCVRAHELGAAELLGSVDQAQPEGRPGILVIDEPAALSPRPGVLTLCPGWEAPGSVLLELAPMSRGEIIAVVQDLMGLSPTLASRVPAHARGLPGRAVALVGHWVALGILRPGPEGFDVPPELALPLPEGFTASDDLDGLDREALEAALWAEVSAGESQSDDVRVRMALDRLGRSGLLVEGTEPWARAVAHRVVGLRRDGQSGRALALGRSAIEACRERGWALLEVRIGAAMAYSLVDRGDAAEARALCDELEPAAARAASPLARSGLAAARAAIAMKLLDLDGAEALHRQVIAICRAEEAWERLGSAHYNLGYLLRTHRRLEESRASFEAAREAYAQVHSARGQANVLYGLADLDMLLSERARARDRFSEAARIYLEAGHLHAYADCLNQLGELARSEGDGDSAVHWMRASLDLRAALGIDLMLPRINLAIVEDLRGRPDRALPALRAALADAEATGHRPGQLLCLGMLASKADGAEAARAVARAVALDQTLEESSPRMAHWIYGATVDSTLPELLKIALRHARLAGTAEMVANLESRLSP